MKVHDVVAHLRVVDCLLRFGLPCLRRRGVIRKYPDNVERRKIAELHALERCQFAAENKMQKLFFGRFLAHGVLLKDSITLKYIKWLTLATSSKQSI